ncbi:predicted protein [Sclerotinia sclerotiorum 1980 UF-70]|uniref:Uncharacterized protein n=2 Tax=Sclerotinia sclerotiorum (strain ATCC 18683 / 1980 / Ss-1) TaxID=665079 RepID=A7E7V9_SCLS1|nr:predicted protein [Sclerotinia sclerotiorum 1980 UF-70]APA06151.1 hypothetical protein sscle_01g009210 [Sclerotinia sclerotiorum 1980 UF-70]EDN96461.1 predicted protein [Sclerotinia sclerotiorum 1980 UF-70]
MGYTHYWSVNEPSKWSTIWPQLIHDANLIIKTLENTAPLLDEKDDYHLPTTEHGIRINGQNYHEDFILTEHQSCGFDFCKTARKDYDIVFAIILMRAKMLAGCAFSLSSDGDWDWDHEWQDVLGVYVKLWPDEERPTGDVLDQ